MPECPENNIKTTFSILDVSKLMHIADIAKEDTMKLVIQNNYIKYDNGVTKVKMVLGTTLQAANDLVVNTFANFAKMGTLASFVVSKETMGLITKGQAYNKGNSDQLKIYFEEKDNAIYASLTDRLSNHIDSYTIFVTDTYTGAIQSPIPFVLSSWNLLDLKQDTTLFIKTPPSARVAGGIFMVELNDEFIASRA